ncbi:MAG: BMP family ABC transporter substrate-binding protein [Candidatus Atribacteria bacterium]|nr:BMP family ABC transporter substrate-binding protein [Candidatus Atribacteria bacterium]
MALYINGNLSDKSFFDSAARGIHWAVKELGIKAKIVEGGYDPTHWEPDLEQLAEGDWDLIITGTYQLIEIVEKIASTHPQKKFVIYDASVDYSKGNLGNVYSILYKQNEGSFLVGALAALLTNSTVNDLNPNQVMGFIGGMDNPVINDFKIGYIQGANYIDPKVKALASYADSFNDPAKGKELAIVQYDNGAVIIFNVAAKTGIGIFLAAQERKKFAIGVDSDQYLLLKKDDPKRAATIITSMIKRVDSSLFRAIQLHLVGKLEYGKAESLGLKEGAVGIADNENYQKIVPVEIRKRIHEIEKKIIDGEIIVDTVFGKKLN